MKKIAFKDKVYTDWLLWNFSVIWPSQFLTSTLKVTTANLSRKAQVSEFFQYGLRKGHKSRHKMTYQKRLGWSQEIPQIAFSWNCSYCIQNLFIFSEFHHIKKERWTSRICRSHHSQSCKSMASQTFFFFSKLQLLIQFNMQNCSTPRPYNLKAHKFSQAKGGLIYFNTEYYFRILTSTTQWKKKALEQKNMLVNSRKGQNLPVRPRTSGGEVITGKSSHKYNFGSYCFSLHFIDVWTLGWHQDHLKQI